MFLSISLLLFSIVVLELSAIVRKSAEEGKFAFLLPLIQSSKVQILNERLQKLMETKDVRNLKTLLIETEIMDGTEKSFEKLQDLELSIVKDLELHYNRILRYLPDDLRSFFEAYKILWDVKNLKSLLRLSSRQRLTDSDFERTAGPYGYIDSSSIRLLAKSDNTKALLERAMSLMPAEFSPSINFENGYPSNDLGFSLDVAAFEYLKQKSMEIGTKKAWKAWNFVSSIYEVKNIVIMARLKYSEESIGIIKQFIFPSQGKADDVLLERLLESDDYTAFLRTLRTTHYGELIPEGMVDPSKVEKSLEEGLKASESYARFTRRDMAVEATICFLTRLEAAYNVIRKAAFFALTKDRYGS